MNFRAIALVATGLALTVACGGGQPEPSTPPPASSAPAPAASAPEAPAASAAPAPSAAPAASAEPDAGAPPAAKTWKEMSHEERVALMKTQVLPKMKAAFQAQDPKDFADFTCVTCHGEGIKKGKADMPNPKLPKLNAKDGFKKETAKHPAMMKFMEETVEPTMATILGLPKWEPTNPGGFGCANCHVVQM